MQAPLWAKQVSRKITINTPFITNRTGRYSRIAQVLQDVYSQLETFDLYKGKKENKALCLRH